ncbi:MAG: hypothetical protein ACYSR9_15895, partial [Planctomycetota bacterium]
MKTKVIFFIQFFMAVLLLPVFLPKCSRANEALWIEGEDYISSSFNNHSWYSQSKISMDLLSPGKPGVSNGNWHAHFTDNDHPDSATVTYSVNITEGGRYMWWIRLNPFRNQSGGANYSYRFKSQRGVEGNWKNLDVSQARDNMNDLVDPGIDIRFIAWSFGDTFELTRGSYEFQIRMSDNNGADKQNHGGIDVMAFTNFPWAPRGVIQPDLNPPAPGRD